jgi:nucleobase:cation symporter-1, NCS1 family
VNNREQAVQLPFVASPLYTGPIARAMGGIDLSWIVGLAVTSPVYYWLAGRAQARRDARVAVNA